MMCDWHFSVNPNHHIFLLLTYGQRALKKSGFSSDHYFEIKQTKHACENPAREQQTQTTVHTQVPYEQPVSKQNRPCIVVMSEEGFVNIARPLRNIALIIACPKDTRLLASPSAS